MPEMISLRQFRLASTTGHVVNFEPNTPVFVPDAAVSEAMAQGCVPVNREDVPFYEDATKAKYDLDADLRKSVIFLAVTAIAADNNPKDFDGAGTPKNTVLGERLGFDVTKAEARAAYEQFQSVAGKHETFNPHPQAQNVMRIVESTTKDELNLLADEYGIPADKAKGLTARDLRKLLMSKVAGMKVA